MTVTERKVRQRRNSLSRLSHLRRKHGLALGEAAAWALVIANTIGGLGAPVTAEAINIMAASFGLPPQSPGVAHAVARDVETARRLWGGGRHTLLTPVEVGELLAVTSIEKDEAELKDICAIDETSEERRRRLDRGRKQKVRAARAAEAGPRLTQAEEAAKAGVSLSTWKRKQRDPKCVRLSELECAHVRVSHARTSPARV